MTEKILSIEPSTIETIDLAVYEWLDKTMNIHSNTNRGWRKVPVIWVSGERAFQIKNDRTLRDVNGNFILPVITLTRESMTKSITKKGSFFANVPADDFRGGVVEVSRKISQEKTNNYARSRNNKKYLEYNIKEKNDKIVYEVAKIPLPTYVDIKYSISFNTEYQQQMNEIVQPFVTYTNSINHFIVRKEEHKYEAFFDKETNIKNDGTFSKLDEQTRLFKSDLSLNVFGYLLGSGNNSDKPKVVISETIVEIKIPKEKEILQEVTDKDKKLFY